ncbi:hypothetical protein [Salibacterium lacus]|uniref:Uncharacterized protein n=1 Tax=Salibacterium lacus TaxID=1898109 RepID=A0ABW5T3K6_9BACI
MADADTGTSCSSKQQPKILSNAGAARGKEDTVSPGEPMPALVLWSEENVRLQRMPLCLQRIPEVETSYGVKANPSSNNSPFYHGFRWYIKQENSIDKQNYKLQILSNNAFF